MCDSVCQNANGECSNSTYITQLQDCPVITTTTSTIESTTSADSTLDSVVVIFAPQTTSTPLNLPLILGLGIPLCLITCAFIVVVVCLLRKKNSSSSKHDRHNNTDQYTIDSNQPEMVSAHDMRASAATVYDDSSNVSVPSTVKLIL
jgi:hypothetical protein